MVLCHLKANKSERPLMPASGRSPERWNNKAEPQPISLFPEKHHQGPFSVTGMVRESFDPEITGGVCCGEGNKYVVRSNFLLSISFISMLQLLVKNLT